MTVNILAVGDVCGKPGLDFLRKHLSTVKKDKNISFTVVNGENANVVGTPGAGFGENGKNFFRLTAFGDRENTIEAVARIKKLLS